MFPHLISISKIQGSLFLIWMDPLNSCQLFQLHNSYKPLTDKRLKLNIYFASIFRKDNSVYSLNIILNWLWSDQALLSDLVNQVVYSTKYKFLLDW